MRTDFLNECSTVNPWLPQETRFPVDALQNKGKDIWYGNGAPAQQGIVALRKRHAIPGIRKQHAVTQHVQKSKIKVIGGVV